MKVIGINSSARKDGNTAILINVIFEELHKYGIETELIQLANQVIEPCRACWACAGHENCVHKKDAFQEIFEKMKEADGILLGSPVYLANISSNMQALLERAAVICDMHEGLLKYKVGAGVVAVRRGGAIHALDSLNHFFLSKEMLSVGSTYWNMAYGRLPGDVLQDEEGINNMRNLGQNMAYALMKLKRESNETSSIY